MERWLFSPASRVMRVRETSSRPSVWREVERVLTNPEVILHELQRLAREKVDEPEVARLEGVLADLQEREKRLVRLYTLGEFREEML